MVAFLLLMFSPLFGFNTTNVCEIGNITYETSQCNGDGNYTVFFNFQHSNTSDSFKIILQNNILGKYAYADLPVSVSGIPGTGVTQVFHFQDLDQPNCSAAKEVHGPDCTPGGECNISDISVIKLECNANNQFNVKINFNHENTSGQFKVQGNGNQYGTFNYADLPIIIGPLNGLVNTDYEFVVKDIEDPECNSFETISAPYCQNGECDISNVTYNLSDCNNEGNYWIYFNFTHQNTSDSFKIYSGNTYYGTFAYANLPVTVTGIPGNGQAHNFIFKDKANPGCAADKNVPGVTCPGNEECDLSELSIMKLECNPNNQFYVKIDFDYVGTGTTFKVQGNGNQYGTFNYADLPITIGPLNGNVNTSYEFVVKDIANPDCNISGFISAPYCQTGECDISNITYELTDCNSEGNYWIYFNFDFQNTSDSFYVFTANNLYGTFAYSDLPVIIYGVPGNGQGHGFLFKDKANTGCAEDIFVPGKTCAGNEECNLSDLSIIKLECNPDGQFNVKINFDHENTSLHFTVQGNGVNYGTFSYADLPIIIGPLNGLVNTTYEFVVKDADHPDCKVSGFITGPYCEQEGCHLYDVAYNLSDCDTSGNYSIYLSLSYQNTSDSFKLYIENLYQGTFAYTDMPVQIDNLPGNGQELHYWFKDAENGDCKVLKEITGPDCDGNNDCDLSELVITQLECNAEGQFNVKINFNHENTSAHFTVQGNGHQYGTFSYSDLPIILGPFNGNTNDTYEFVIKDADHPDCAIDGFITGPYCIGEECHITSVAYEASECDSSGHFNVFFNLVYQNTSDSFKVFQANQYLGTFAYTDLPVSFGSYEGNGQTLVFSFHDLLNPNCAKAKEVHAPNCNEENCHIYDITYNLSDCNGEGYYKIYLNFQHENTSNQFKLYVDNVYKGTYLYSALPVEAGPFLGNGQAHTYKVKDVENGDCSSVREIHGPQCIEQNNCQIGEVTASISNCDEDGNFYVEIDFEYSNVSDSFKIQGNGINYGFFAYSDLPVVLGPFNGESEMSYEFGIKDQQHPDCHAGTFITPPYCENGFDDPVMQISISNIICIDEDKYYADLDINHEVTGNISLNLWEENNLIGEYMSNSFPRQVILNTDVLARVKINETDEPGNFAVKAYTHPDCLLATDKYDEQNLQVFPNPSSNDLTLNWKEVSYVYQLFDVNNRLVLKGKGSDKTQIHTADLQPGVYFLQISTGTQILVRKVMKI